MSSSGHAASSSGCAIRPRVQEIGSTGSAERIPSSSPTGRYAMATAEQWEPYESRGSRTVLGEPGGESPPGHSSKAAHSFHARMSAATSCGHGPSSESDVMGHNPPPALQKNFIG